ncbi:NACHT domain-containing protein [Aeromonas jandaei]|uniref:NACHT domain-containing protein n=1 Tax=Aeromonas jandaei TaxID=650 RepID=UPI001C5B1AC4|nr:NACHT domain-containing protein [Aeromonas jandaei]MBW3804672.1 NACHT domain-containing protein [Aeromonas jandaei]
MLENILVTETLKATISEAISFLKAKSSAFKKLDKINTLDVYQKASNVENVKTFWQIDKSVNLNEFYYPSKITVDNNIISVHSLDIFPENCKVVIQGTAGQGKSILLRYLAGARLKEGKTIPIFVELMKITEKNTIQSTIVNSINDLGFNVEEKDLDLIYSSNKFTLLLDAFDEIPETCLRETLNYLDSLCSKYRNQQIIISSRPGADIQKISFFSVYDLEPLQPSDFKPILLKFFNKNETTVHQILKSLHENGSEIARLITTPLLLTLLAVTYKTYTKIPSQLHEFYENIFYLLVNRHDSTKPGFRREYKSGLNEKQLEELFCAFCFYCTIEDKTSLSRQEALAISKRSIQFTRVTPSSDFSFLNDCIKNTCLLLEEGFRYHYIHKSIREYHASRFISSSPIELKEKFYTIAKENPYRYKVELDFLKVIDDHYFQKYFLLPSYNEMLSEVNIGEHLRSVNLKDVLSGVTIYFNEKEHNLIHSISLGNLKILNFIYMRQLRNNFLRDIFDTLYISGFDNKNHRQYMSALDVIDILGLTNDFELAANKYIKEIFEYRADIKVQLEQKNKLISDLCF